MGVKKKYILYLLVFRIWHTPRTYNYVIDLIDFNTAFEDCYNFQMTWNPVHPIAAFKFGNELWLTLLPGKYKNSQGQILYRMMVRNNNSTHLESCQWSPDGNILMVLRKTSVVPRQKSTFTEYAKAGIILVQKIRERYVARELKNGWDQLPTCYDLSQLSSE